MRRKIFALVLFYFMAVGGCYAQVSKAHRFAVDGDHFILDGKPFQVISGEMHYPRIPRAYWHERFRMAKAMGLNTITTYVFWNVHEPQPGEYDFSGNNDVAEFVREAQQEGLYVILRPGPYVLRRVGVWRLPRVALGGSRHGGTHQRSKVYRCSCSMDRSSW